MISRENPRPGGRSARVQASVHDAVRALCKEMDRTEITIPVIAQRAGVTPSTIYRRWGDLSELLGDVAVERLKPETEPTATGSVLADLEIWAEQYADEMSSEVGRRMIRDILAAPDVNTATRCCSFTRAQLAFLVERAAREGIAFPEVPELMDHVVSPIMYRILFDEAPPTADYTRALIRRLMNGLPQGQDAVAAS